MNILIYTSETGTGAGGLALHCVQLKEIFENLGHTVYVEVILNPDEIFVVDGGYDKALSKKIRTAYMIKRIHETYSGQVDLCVSCGAGRTAYYAMLFCKKNNIPLYVVLCGSEINIAYESSEISFFNSESLKYASKVIGLSEELNTVARVFGTNSMCEYYVVPNYCEMKEISSDKVINSVRPSHIVYATGASFLGEKKGIGNLIIAFAKLINEKKRDDRLYLFGKIDTDVAEQYKKLIEENHIEKNICFCGYLEREEFHSRMDEVDVFIQASPFEGYGNSVVEAICEGKNILISNTGYIAEVLSESFSEHIFMSLNPNDMADRMCEYGDAIVNKNDIKELREYLKERLSKEYVITKWREILGTKEIIVSENTSEICNAVMFHDINNSYTGIDYNRDGFEQVVNCIYNRGMRLCSAREFFRTQSKENLIVCTFDDAYENVYRNAFPIMKKYDFTATIYVCPDLIGEDNSWNHKDEVNRSHMSDEMIKAVVDYGWEVGSHGMAHMNLHRLSEDALVKSLVESKRMLDIYGPIESFCYPYGAFNDFIKNKVKQIYSNAFSVSIGGNNVSADRYQITRMTPEELKNRLGL